jgi:hypothetical protein
MNFSLISDENNVLRERHLERFNIAADSKTFDCKFIEPGIISYRDQGGGIELLKKETIDACIQTAIGNPVTIGHVWVTSENRMDVENGIIQEVCYNAEDGWFHVKGMVDTEQAKAEMRVKRPSCGYAVTSFGPGGTYHGIRYDKEITGIQFNHLAIVDRPRYEEATFRLNHAHNDNSENMKIFKFLKKLVTRENGTDGKPVETVKTVSSEISGSTTVEIDGVEVRLNDLAETWMKQTKDAVVHKAESDDEVEIDGKNVRIHELVEAYRKARCNESEAEMAKKKHENEAEAEAEKKKHENEAPKPAEEKRENAAPGVPEVTAPAPVVNTPKDTNAFNALRSARENGQPADSGLSLNSGSLQDRLKRGKERY